MQEFKVRSAGVRWFQAGVQELGGFNCRGAGVRWFQLHAGVQEEEEG